MNEKAEILMIQSRDKDSDEQTTQNLLLTVGGVEVSVCDIDIHKIEHNSIVMATITLPVKFK